MRKKCGGGSLKFERFPVCRHLSRNLFEGQAVRSLTNSVVSAPSTNPESTLLSSLPPFCGCICLHRGPTPMPTHILSHGAPLTRNTCQGERQRPGRRRAPRRGPVYWGDLLPRLALGPPDEQTSAAPAGVFEFTERPRGVQSRAPTWPRGRGPENGGSGGQAARPKEREGEERLRPTAGLRVPWPPRRLPHMGTAPLTRRRPPRPA